MHTLFTLAIYGALGAGVALNRTNWGVLGKAGACAAAVLILWDVPGVFHAVWAPFAWLVSYVDPRKPVRCTGGRAAPSQGCARRACAAADAPALSAGRRPAA
jgi:hypothetical protein